ncbi:MAG: nitrite reductase (NAD(P)H) small subunit [Gemmatimonadaceae bacterium]
MSATPTSTDLVLARVDLGPIDRIPPGEGQTFLVGEREIAVFRTREDTVYATQARCPHKAGLLADGLVGGGKVICPLHSYKFDLATGTPLGNNCASLRTYRSEVTVERRVIVWVMQPTSSDWNTGA